MPESYLFRPNMTQLINVLLEHGANPNARIAKGTNATANISPGGGMFELGLAGATPLLLAGRERRCGPHADPAGQRRRSQAGDE